MRFDTKIAVVLRDDLAGWQRLNVCAFLSSGIAAAVPELIGEPYADADGTGYLAMFGRPVVVLEAAVRAVPFRALDLVGIAVHGPRNAVDKIVKARGRTPRLARVHVCFVCSGNICRSPMAALVFGEHLRRAGLAGKVRVTSAGIGDWHVGEEADSRARRALAGAGYPTEHVAAQVGPEHLDADLLVAMDSGHLSALVDLAGPERVRMFRSFDPAADGDLDVPDPYYGHRDGFAEVLAMIEAATPGLLEWVRERL